MNYLGEKYSLGFVELVVFFVIYMEMISVRLYGWVWRRGFELEIDW